MITNTTEAAEGLFALRHYTELVVKIQDLVEAFAVRFFPDLHESFHLIDVRKNKPVRGGSEEIGSLQSDIYVGSVDKAGLPHREGILLSASRQRLIWGNWIHGILEYPKIEEGEFAEVVKEVVDMRYCPSKQTRNRIFYGEWAATVDFDATELKIQEIRNLYADVFGILYAQGYIYIGQINQQAIAQGYGMLVDEKTHQMVKGYWCQGALRYLADFC